MKIRISYDLTLDETSYNIETVQDIVFTLGNIGNLLGGFKSKRMEDKMDIYSWEDNLREPALKCCDEDIQILGTMFDNFAVQGETEDGHFFEFLHKKPYIEEMIIDGVKQE